MRVYHQYVGPKFIARHLANDPSSRMVCEAVLQADGQWFDTHQGWKTFLMSLYNGVSVSLKIGYRLRLGNNLQRRRSTRCSTLCTRKDWEGDKLLPTFLIRKKKDNYYLLLFSKYHPITFTSLICVSAITISTFLNVFK